jgi:hypothetical protein
MSHGYMFKFTHASILVAGLALGLGLTALSLSFNAPAPPADEAVADFLLGVRDAILRRESPDFVPPPPPAWTLLDVSLVATPAMGVVGILLAMIGAFRAEPRRFVAFGIAMGSAAILLQVFFWALLVICGVILLVEVLRNLDGIMDLG